MFRLLGSGSAGKSTIFKQFKCVRGLGLAETEFEETEHTIRANLVAAILVLLKQSELLFDIDPILHKACKIDLNNPENQDIVNWIQHVLLFANDNFESFQATLMTNNEDADQVENELNYLGVCIGYVYIRLEKQIWNKETKKKKQKKNETIRNLWNLPQMQETFNRREMFSFPDNLDWFLSKSEDIFSLRFEPNDDDVLRVRIRTSGLTHVINTNT